MLNNVYFVLKLLNFAVLDHLKFVGVGRKYYGSTLFETL
jgi:hypothetical protein